MRAFAVQGSIGQIYSFLSQIELSLYLLTVLFPYLSSIKIYSHLLFILQMSKKSTANDLTGAKPAPVQSKGRGKSRGSSDTGSGGSGPGGPAQGPMGGPGTEEVQGPMVQPLSTPIPSTFSSLPIAGPKAVAKEAVEAAGEELQEKHEVRTSMDPTGYGGNPGYGGPEGNFGVLPISSPSTSSSRSHPLPSMPRLSILSGDYGTPMQKDDVSELSEAGKSARSKSSKSSSVSISRSVFAAMQAQLQASLEALLANARAVQVREERSRGRRGARKAKGVLVRAEGEELSLTPRLTPGFSSAPLPAESFDMPKERTARAERGVSKPSGGREVAFVPDGGSESSSSSSSSFSSAETDPFEPPLTRKLRKLEKKERRAREKAAREARDPRRLSAEAIFLREARGLPVSDPLPATHPVAPPVVDTSGGPVPSVF